MKETLTERLFIEELFTKSVDKLSLNKVSSLSIDGLTGDAGTRKYYRLVNGDEKYVVCLDNPLKNYTQMKQFVDIDTFLEKHNLRVPHIYDQDLDKGYLLEEDLGDVTLLKYLSQMEGVNSEMQVYTRILDELVKLHSIPSKEISNSGIFELKFDYQKYIEEIEFSIKFFFNHFIKDVPESDQKLIRDYYSPICKRLADQKMVLTHRDFHSRNVMVKNDEFITIDFQDARLGIPQYDLCSILDDCYYKVWGSNKTTLMKYYYDALDEKNHGQGSFEQFLSLYNDMVLQRSFKAIGSFAYIYHTRRDERYIKYIGFAMEKIKKTLLRNTEYKDLRKLFMGIYYGS
jgi:aminoglycoside/choline kinase family phosphotransferase